MFVVAFINNKLACYSKKMLRYIMKHKPHYKRLQLGSIRSLHHHQNSDNDNSFFYFNENIDFGLRCIGLIGGTGGSIYYDWKNSEEGYDVLRSMIFGFIGFGMGPWLAGATMIGVPLITLSALASLLPTSKSLKGK